MDYFLLVLHARILLASAQLLGCYSSEDTNFLSDTEMAPFSSWSTPTSIQTPERSDCIFPFPSSPPPLTASLSDIFIPFSTPATLTSLLLIECCRHGVPQGYFLAGLFLDCSSFRHAHIYTFSLTVSFSVYSKFSLSVSPLGMLCHFQSLLSYTIFCSQSIVYILISPTLVFIFIVYNLSEISVL